MRASKSGLYLKQITFVGHICDEHGIHADPKKVEAIRGLAVPTDADGIRRLLGVCGYYRRYYPQPFARHTGVLTKLLRKDKDTGFNVEFVWGPEEQAEFEFLTTGLADAVALEFPDWSLPFSLRTDASKVGFAAVLSQTIPKTKRRRMIAVCSRQTIGAEKNYDPRELEVGCTVWALQHFRTWLLHRHFYIETDHANTRWVLDYGMDKHNSKLQRWSAQLSEFDFEFTWKCGESMIEPDTLSRAPLPASPDEPAPLETPLVTNLEQAARAMLAKAKPADATPMSAEKAKAIVIERNQRELAKMQAEWPAYQARRKAKATLAKPKPADANPMSAEKATAIGIERSKRALAKTEAAWHGKRPPRGKMWPAYSTQQRQQARAERKSALVNKNSAFCPDRPSPDDEITTGSLRAWHEHATDDADQCWKTDSAAASGSLHEGQENPSTPLAPTMFIIAHGLSTDAMAAKNLGIEVVGGSEVDPKLAEAFTQRTGARSYPGMEQLIDGGDQGQYPELHDLDIVTSGLPCPHRSNAGSLTSRSGKAKREAGPDRHLFTKQVEFYRVFRPRSVMIEQPPPSSPHMQDYLYVVAGMRELGYSTTQKVVNCADHGDGTCRRRWFLLCLRNKGAIRWPEPLAVFKMAASILDDPKTVCLGRYVPKGAARFVPRHPGNNRNEQRRFQEGSARPYQPPYRQEPTRARKLGYYTVHGVHEDRALRVYDPLYPLPSATSTMSMRHLGSPGGLVRNFCGDYQVSPLEVARAHSFSADALRQVEKLECTKEQWRWVANSTPRKTVQALLGAVLEALHCPHQLGLQDAGPITSQSHEMVRSVAACAASRGLPSEPATEAELAASVQRLINSMPTREQLAALQAADPETKQLLEWYRLGRSRTTQPELPRPWRTEAR